MADLNATLSARTWKSFDWDAMERLHRKGLISDPVSYDNHAVEAFEQGAIGRRDCRGRPPAR